MKLFYDELTHLLYVGGRFDLLVDWDVYDDLTQADRRAYRRNVLPLTHSQSRFRIYVHEWSFRWFDRLIYLLFRYGPIQPGEIETDFGSHFDIETVMRRYSGQGCLAGGVHPGGWPVKGQRRAARAERPGRRARHKSLSAYSPTLWQRRRRAARFCAILGALTAKIGDSP